MKKIIITSSAVLIMLLTTITALQAQPFKTKKPFLRDIPTAATDDQASAVNPLSNVVVSSSQGQLTLHFTKDVADKASITFYDITGRVIFRDVAEKGADAFYKTYELNFSKSIIIIDIQYQSIQIVKKAMV